MDHSPALRKYFQSQVFRDDVAGRHGMMLPKALFDAQLYRVVRGLHWHHYGDRLPIDIAMRAYQLDAQKFEYLKQDMSMELTASHVGFDQFSYFHGRAVDEPGASLWLLSFYRRLHFGVVVGMPAGAASSS